VLFCQPVLAGDVVNVADIEGVVDSMESAGVVIKKWSGELITIPYTRIWQSPLQVSSHGERKLSVIYAIDHDEPIEQVVEAIQQTVKSKKMVGVKGEVSVEVTGMTHGHTEFAVSWYCDAGKRSAKSSKSKVYEALENLLIGPILEAKKVKPARKRQKKEV